jgi:Heterokaryon incompatibility protein (HET)
VKVIWYFSYTHRLVSLKRFRRDKGLNELLGDPAEQYGITVKRDLSNTASSGSFETVATWIEDCKENHICSKRLPLKDLDHDFQTWPARLVDVRAFGNDDMDVRLADNDGSARKYCTLSYCWGTSKTFTTTSRSLRLRKTRINFHSLPGTFRDAVTITRQLGVRWLWIDALCIVQDDRRDWEQESVKMGAIYSMAYVTVAADSGKDCTSGCFNFKSTSQELAFDNVPFELHSTNLDGRTSKVYLWDPSVRGVQKPTPPEIDGSPLAERGWVCQERILSPRILHYTSTQLFWECRQVLLAEDNLRPWTLWASNQSTSGTVCGLARNLYGSTTDPAGLSRLLGIWYNAVVAQSYSRRKLTLPDDKLTAISGIARAFARHFRTKYVAGLWLLDISWGLSWRRRGTATYTPSYRAPSFSWAAFDALVEWPMPSLEQKSRLAVLETHIVLSGTDPFGRVTACSLVVEGYVHTAMIGPRKRMTASGVDLTWELLGDRGQWLGTAHLDDDSGGDTGLESINQVDYLVLSYDDRSKHSRVLLIERTDVEGEYSRVGFAELLGLDDDIGFFDEDCLVRLTLV